MSKSKINNLQEAFLSPVPPAFLDPHSYQSPAMRKGLDYEKKVKEYLLELFDLDQVVLGPWIRYDDGLKWRWAQPDIVLIPREAQHLVIGEVKLTWRPAAVRKLENLYEPLCRKVWPNYQVKKAQICRGIKKNCKVSKWHQLEDILSPDKPDHFDVHWF
tara:strand:- start:366 stop:842 length:477 start_codon:yes stop_codon:yes gene_type:complete